MLDKLLPGGGSLEAVNLGGEEYDEESIHRSADSSHAVRIYSL